MTPEEAIEQVARGVIRDVVADAIERGDVEWADYPDLGERDWNAVLDKADEIAQERSVDKFNEAYALLAGRASRDL